MADPKRLSRDGEGAEGAESHRGHLSTFLQAGVPRGMIAAGIEALAAGVEELRQAA